MPKAKETDTDTETITVVDPEYDTQADIDAAIQAATRDKDGNPIPLVPKES